jgi:hypothetical protein
MNLENGNALNIVLRWLSSVSAFWCTAAAMTITATDTATTNTPRMEESTTVEGECAEAKKNPLLHIPSVVTTATETTRGAAV